MNLLVTGGCGFIGSNFIRYMLTRHEYIKITNLDALLYGSSRESLKEFEESSRYKFIRGRIEDEKVLNALIKDIDVVVNFAAQTHVDRSISKPRDFFRCNTLGMMVLLDAIRKNGKEIKLIQISTDEVYGDLPAGSSKEDDPLRPSSPYSATKAAADMLCLAYYRTYGLDVRITRCTNNFGPYQFPEKLIPKTIIRAHLGMKVPIYGTGNNMRDWIYVIDHCEAIERVMFKGKPGNIYNISTGNEFTNLELVRRVLRLMNKPDSYIQFVDNRPGHDLRYSLDSSKIRNELLWKPKHNFEEALARTVEWYLENKAWWAHLASKKILHPKPWILRW